MNWWVLSFLQADNGVLLLIAVTFWAFFSVTLHELGHGWAAIRLGDDTPIATGHMTWNPIVHTGVNGLIAFALMGMIWGMMPVNPARMKGRYAEAKMAFAGPFMNLSLAVTTVVGCAIVNAYGSAIPDPFRSNLFAFMFWGACYNLALFGFNLMPIMPLDGGRIARNALPFLNRFYDSSAGQGICFIAFLVALFAGGRFVLPASAIAVSLAIGALTALLVLAGTP